MDAEALVRRWLAETDDGTRPHWAWRRGNAVPRLYRAWMRWLVREHGATIFRRADFDAALVAADAEGLLLH